MFLFDGEFFSQSRFDSWTGREAEGIAPFALFLTARDQERRGVWISSK